MRARTVTGAHLVCYVNGQPYSKVSSFAWESRTSSKPIYGIDSPDPYELGPTQTHLSGTLNVYRTLMDKGAQGAGIVPSFEEFVNGKYFALTIIDRSTDTLIFQSDSCMLQSESWSAASRSVMSGSLSFEAITWTNQ